MKAMTECIDPDMEKPTRKTNQKYNIIWSKLWNLYLSWLSSGHDKAYTEDFGVSYPTQFWQCTILVASYGANFVTGNQTRVEPNLKYQMLPLYYDVTVYFHVKIVPKPQYLIKPFLNPHAFLFSR